MLSSTKETGLFCSSVEAGQHKPHMLWHISVDLLCKECPAFRVSLPMAVCESRGKGAADVVLKIATVFDALALLLPIRLIRFRAPFSSSMDLRQPTSLTFLTMTIQKPQCFCGCLQMQKALMPMRRTCPLLF